MPSRTGAHVHSHEPQINAALSSADVGVYLAEVGTTGGKMLGFEDTLALLQVRCLPDMVAGEQDTQGKLGSAPGG